LEEAKKKLEELKTEKSDKEKKRDSYFEKLKNITDWDKL
jgi:hypothetical protein